MGSGNTAEQLDTIIALLKLTNRDKLDSAREKLDNVERALIEATAEPVVIGKLKKDIAVATKQSKKTVQRRIGNLTVMGVLAKSGGGATATYRSTGLL